MKDRPWAVVRDLGSLGMRIDSTHKTKLAAHFFAAISTGLVVVHETEHAKEMQKKSNEDWVAVFGSNGEEIYIDANEEAP